jgi:putative ABC transport system substrate-binding protein
MKRREFIAGLGGAAAWTLAARAQQLSRPPWVALFAPGKEGDVQGSANQRVFAAALEKLGWIDGRNVRIEQRWGGNDEDRIRTISGELAENSPNAILAFGTQVTTNLKRQTTVIPIVFVNTADPVAMGFVESFAHPGGNITGLTSVEFSFAGKWLSILRELAPAITNVMVLYTPDNPNLTGFLRTIEVAAQALHVNIRPTPVSSADELARNIEAFAREPAGGIIVLPGGQTTTHRETIAALAASHRLPAIYPYRYFAEIGGLASYGSDDFDVLRRAAEYVDRILRGEKPSGLPVMQPTKFEFVINLKTAKALGLEIPPTLLAIADEVIE